MSSVFARALTMIAVVLQSYIGNKENEVGKVDNGNDASIGSSAAYHLAGLVLARGGSKGIVRKNLVEIQGQPLIGRALNSMIESGGTNGYLTFKVITCKKEIRSRPNVKICIIKFLPIFSFYQHLGIHG